MGVYVYMSIYTRGVCVCAIQHTLYDGKWGWPPLYADLYSDIDRYVFANVPRTICIVCGCARARMPAFHLRCH